MRAVGSAAVSNKRCLLWIGLEIAINDGRGRAELVKSRERPFISSHLDTLPFSWHVTSTAKLFLPSAATICGVMSLHLEVPLAAVQELGARPLIGQCLREVGGVSDPLSEKGRE